MAWLAGDNLGFGKKRKVEPLLYPVASAEGILT